MTAVDNEVVPEVLQESLDGDSSQCRLLTLELIQEIEASDEYQLVDRYMTQADHKQTQHRLG